MSCWRCDQKEEEEKSLDYVGEVQIGKLSSVLKKIVLEFNHHDILLRLIQYVDADPVFCQKLAGVVSELIEKYETSQKEVNGPDIDD